MAIHAVYPSGDVSEELMEAAEICFQCGVCCVLKAHSCHAQYDGQFNPRHTFVYDCLGAEEPVENPNLWLCVSCHKCEELCPYDVSPVHFIEAMKAKAFEMGDAHPSVLREIEQIVETGFAFPLTRSSARQREALELEPLKTTALEDLKIITEETGLRTKLRRQREADG